MRLVYRDGIDNAANVASTRLEPIRADDHASWEFDAAAGTMVSRVKDPKQQYQRHLVGIRPQDVTPGAVLAARRKEMSLQIEAREERSRRKDQAQVQERLRQREELVRA